jgi:anti-anti-sigma factor
MAIQNLSENIVVVTLPEEPLINNDLENVNEFINKEGNCHVVIDFSRVEVLTSSNLSNLLILRESLRKSGYQLVFCSVSMATKGIFIVAGLDTFFDFADDKLAALEIIKHGKLAGHPSA